MKKCYLLFALLFAYTSGFAQTEIQGLKKILVRRNVKSFTQAEINELTQAIVAMKYRPSLFDPTVSAYDYFPKIHWAALNGEDHSAMAHAHSTTAMPEMGHIAHENPGFLPWHREFIKRVEQELKISTSKSDYTLPYWDWTDRSYDSYLFSTKFMGSDGLPTANYEVQDGAFGKKANQFHVTYQSSFDNPEGGSLYLQRHLGGSLLALSLPTASEVSQAMSIGTYDVYPWNAEVTPQRSFRQFLEGFRPIKGISPTTIAAKTHGQVHIYVGGHLLSDASPNDPLFFLHHCNVDRLFAEWQDRWGIYNFPRTWADTLHDVTHSWKDMMPPFESAFRDMLDLRATGVRYDTQRTVGRASESIENMTVFPNPTTDLVQITLDNITHGEVQIQLLNTLGIPLQTQYLWAEEKTVQATFDLENHRPGIYLLRAEYDGYTVSKKVIKQ